MDYKKVFETMVSETAKYLTNNHLKTMVLGLSAVLFTIAVIISAPKKALSAK